MKFTQQLLSGIVVMSLVVAQLTATKLTMFTLPVVGSVVLPAGVVGIAVAFLATDLLGEVYGKDAAKYAANTAVACLVGASALVALSVAMPAAPFYPHNDAYVTILSGSHVIMVAGVVTLFVSQNLDVHLFHRLREATGGRHKWARNVGSTATSQLVDTALFIGLAFVVFPSMVGGDVLPLAVAGSLIVGQYSVKLGVALLDTPIFYLLTRGRENERQ